MAPDTIPPDITAYPHEHAEEAEIIVREIIAAMTLRLVDAGKVFSAGALDQWRMGLLAQVKEQLKHGNWDDDRETVLAVAADMATIAIILAYKGDVDKERVDAAFAAIKLHRRCPAGGGASRARTLGCWCDCFP